MRTKNKTDWGFNIMVTLVVVLIFFFFLKDYKVQPLQVSNPKIDTPTQKRAMVDSIYSTK